MSDLLSPSSSLIPAPTCAPTTAPVPAVEAPPLDGRKKKSKVRSAWIAFAGRIVAQVIGAVATVVLGVTIVNSHMGKVAAPVAATPAAATAPAVAADAPAPILARARRTPGAALVVLPFQDFSPAGPPAALADGLTEAVTAALARSGRVRVTSRTSAMQYKQARSALPVIAAELGVDFVVEGSLVRQGDRVRVTVQLIDAATDTHVWAQTYDRPAGDVLAFGADIGAVIDRDLAGVLPRSLQSSSPSTTATADLPPLATPSRPVF
jgi:TolB-like protein